MEANFAELWDDASTTALDQVRAFMRDIVSKMQAEEISALMHTLQNIWGMTHEAGIDEMGLPSGLALMALLESIESLARAQKDEMQGGD